MWRPRICRSAAEPATSPGDVSKVGEITTASVALWRVLSGLMPLPPDTGAARRAELLADLLKQIEVVHSTDYGRFLSVALRPLLGLLAGTPVQTEATAAQKVRHTVLDILRSLPCNQVDLRMGSVSLR